MRPRWLAAVGAVGLVGSLSIGVLSAPSASAMQGRRVLMGSLTPNRERAHSLGAVPKTTPMTFDVMLALRDRSGAISELKAVSDPSSPAFHHFLTDSQWTARYGPSRAAVRAARSWLRGEGFTAGATPKDRMFVPVNGTAAQVERTFGTTLGYYKVAGERVILANSSLSVPARMAGSITSVVGVNQHVARAASVSTATLRRTEGETTRPVKLGQEPPPPSAFVNAKPCSAYWGQLLDTKDSPKLYAPYKSPLPYDICGYTPKQLRSAYRLTSSETGKGATIAIVDAYDSPTLLSDAQKYFSTNDPAIPLTSSQFENVEPSNVDYQNLCDGSGWYGEQALDVESSHTIAPQANILYVGARNCLDSGLLSAIDTAVTSGASVVSDSWDDVLGDLFEDAAGRRAFDDEFLMAGATGVSVLFCSHDYGDNFAYFGLDAPNYPAVSPYVTSVGGTAIEIGKTGNMEAQYGWSTGFQGLCAPEKAPYCGKATKPLNPAVGYGYGGAGGTSWVYTQPWYQAGIVPAALSERNAAFNGPVPYRVNPDISMDADVQTGMLIGLTQAFPNGTRYAQYKIGGTSLASPLFAGIIADTVQASKANLGFVNPLLYKAYSSDRSAFVDVLAPKNPDAAATIRVDYYNYVNASDGYYVSLDTLNYEGPETYCDATGNCATRPVTLTDNAKGFNSMTGLGTVSPSFVSVLSKF